MDIFLAASLGDVEGVSRCSSRLDATHPQLEYSALHAAVDFDRNNVVRFLLQNGADANSQKERQGQTPLHFAVAHGNTDVVASLLEYGANATVKDDLGRRPHELAADVTLRDLLRDPPPQVHGLRLASVEPRRLTIRWLPTTSIDSDVAPTSSYLVTWGQPKPRCENPLYAKVKAAYNVVDVGTLHPVRRSAGSKLRHVRRRDKIRTFDTWRLPTREPFHATKKYREKEFVSSIENLFPATCYTVSVRAKNASASSPGIPARIDDVVTTRNDAPEPPGQPFLLRATTNQVVVAWLPPRFLNGTPVTKFQIDSHVFGGGTVPEHRRRESTGRLDRSTRERQRPSSAQGTSSPASTKLSHLTRTMPKGQVDPDPKTWKIDDWASYQVDADTHYCSVPVPTPEDGCVVRVRARNNDGWSSWSPLSKIFRATDSLRAFNVGTRSLELAWDSHAIKAEYWEVQYRRSSSRWMTVLESVSPAPSVRVKLNSGDHLFVPGDSYQFRVRPYFCGDFLGNEATLTTTQFVAMKEDVPDPCKPPTREDCDGGTTDIALAWKVGHCNGQPILSFELEQRYVALGAVCEQRRRLCDDAKRIATELPSAIVSKIEPGRPTIFRVRSQNIHGWSEWSEPSVPMSIVSISPPSAPRLVKAGSTWLHVEWDPPREEVLAYQVYYKSNYTEDDWTRCPLPPEKTTLAAPKNDAVVSDLKPAREFMLRVSASTLQGISPLSEPSPPFATTKRY